MAFESPLGKKPLRPEDEVNAGASPAAPAIAPRPQYRDVSSSDAQRQWSMSNARAEERATASAAAAAAAAQQRQQRSRDQAMAGVQALGAKYRPPVMTTAAPPASTTPAVAAAPAPSARSAAPGQMAKTANAGTSPVASSSAPVPARAATPATAPTATPPQTPALAAVAASERATGAVRLPAAGQQVNVISPTRADFGTVRPPTRRPAPAQGAVTTPTSTTASGLVPGMRTLDGRAGGLASSVNAQGNPVYDNNSIRRLEERLDQRGGNAATPSAASTAVGQFPAPAVEGPRIASRPAASGGTGAAIGNPDEDRRRLQIALDSATRRPARSRGERAVQGQMVEAIAGEYAQRQDIAGQAARAQLDAQTRQGIASQDREARLQEAQLGSATALQERAMQVAGDERTQRMARRPDPITTADGTMGTIGEDGVFAPVTDRQGRTVRGAATKADQLSLDARLRAYTDQKTAISEDTNLTAEQRTAAIDALDKDPLFAPLRGGVSADGNASGQGGLTVAGTTPDGKTVYRDAAGNTFTDE